MFNFLKAGWRRFWERNDVIKLSPDGFEFLAGGNTRKLRWDAVTKIEVFRIPTFVVEDFCVALFQKNGEPLVIVDRHPGFLKFQSAIWQRWPQIKDRWIAIYCGSPDTRERAVLWES